MTPGVEFLTTADSVEDAALRMRAADIGAIPVCAPSGQLVGIVTDRDIVTEVVAVGKNPIDVPLERLVDEGGVVTIGADDSVEDTLEMMKRYKVRRLPVIDGTEVIGVVSQGDLARRLPKPQVGEFLAAVSS